MGEEKKVIVYGADWCPDCDRVKRLLIDGGVDFQYVNIDQEAGAAEEVVRLSGGRRVIPVVKVEGEALVNPDDGQLAARLGLEAASGRPVVYDVVIVGAGVTGLSAAIYTTRERLRTVLLEKAVAGGQILSTAAVENYPGFPDPVSGAELTDRLAKQARRFGAEIVERTEVKSIESRDDIFTLHAVRDEKEVEYRGRSVILAPGSQYRRLKVPGEREFTGYGVSYCGTCDAPFYRGKHVVAVGGGNTAVDEGLHLLKFVSKLTVVQNQERLTATPFLVEDLMKRKEQVEVLTLTTVVRIEGRPEERVTGVVLKDLKTGEERPYPCDGVFVWIGMVPNTGFVGDFVALDDHGFIIAGDCDMTTAVPGVFAAGDCRSGSKKQIATAAGEGVIAALVAADYLKKQKRAGAEKK